MRNPNIDALRLIAAIGVISLHSGSYSELPPLAGDIITSIFRWTVPAFFIITGFYLADDRARMHNLTINQITKPLMLFGAYSIVYLPLFVARSGVGSINLELLTRGTDVHLWYLSALPLALAVINSVSSQRLLSAIAALILGCYIAANFIFAETHKIYGCVMVLREFVGVPCILAGAIIKGNPRTQSIYGLAFIGGSLMLMFEIISLHFIGRRAIDIQFGFSTLPIAVGLVGLMVSRKSLFPSFISKLGRDDSQGIYVFHRWGMVLAASIVAKKPTIFFDNIPSVLLWGLTAIVTFAGLGAVRWLSPFTRELIDGRSRSKTMNK